MNVFHLLTSFILISILVGGCRQEKSQQITVELEPLRVSTEKAQLVPVRNRIELLGTIHSSQKAEIEAKVSGTIAEFPVILGSDVNKGDLLVKISAGEIAAKLKQSKAQLAQARRNLERERKLLRKNAATTESVKFLEESLSVAAGVYEEAKTMLGYTHILAPFSGKVTAKPANIGDLANPGKILLTVEDDKNLQVVVDIPEAMILTINVGDTFPVIVPAAEFTVIGRVAEVAPTTNPTTRSGLVKLNLDYHPKLRSGQFTRIDLSTEDVKTLIVPSESITTIGQMERVFVVENEKARLRLVRSGQRYGDSVEILSGLAPESTIIVNSDGLLHDGQPVILQKP